MKLYYNNKIRWKCILYTTERRKMTSSTYTVWRWLLVVWSLLNGENMQNIENVWWEQKIEANAHLPVRHGLLDKFDVVQ